MILFKEQTSGCQSANIHADNCYDVVSEPLAYNAARGQCILRGGRLAKISDSEVNSFLASICDVQVTPTVYIGLDDQETEGRHMATLTMCVSMSRKEYYERKKKQNKFKFSISSGAEPN